MCMDSRFATYSLRGAAPLGLPYTLSREPLRRLAPFAWAHSRARSPALLGAAPLGLPYTLAREPLRRLASASAKATARPRRSLGVGGRSFARLASVIFETSSTLSRSVCRYSSPPGEAARQGTRTS